MYLLLHSFIIVVVFNIYVYPTDFHILSNTFDIVDNNRYILLFSSLFDVF